MIRRYLKAVFLFLVCVDFSGVILARQVKIYPISNRKIPRGFSFIKKTINRIALMNINSTVETIKGEFNLQPSPLSGTLATIKIPVK